MLMEIAWRGTESSEANRLRHLGKVHPGDTAWSSKRGDRHRVTIFNAHQSHVNRRLAQQCGDTITLCLCILRISLDEVKGCQRHLAGEARLQILSEAGWMGLGQTYVFIEMESGYFTPVDRICLHQVGQ
jgi:hypothetical protein